MCPSGATYLPNDCCQFTTTLKIISRKFLEVSLIWTFFSHVGAIIYETALNGSERKYEKFSIFLSNLPDKVFIIKIIMNIFT
jgi:hypothetical protein